MRKIGRTRLTQGSPTVTSVGGHGVRAGKGGPLGAVPNELVDGDGAPGRERRQHLSLRPSVGSHTLSPSHTLGPISQPASQPTNQSASEWVSPSVNQTVRRPACPALSYLVRPATCRQPIWYAPVHSVCAICQPQMSSHIRLSPTSTPFPGRKAGRRGVGLEGCKEKKKKKETHIRPVGTSPSP